MKSNEPICNEATFNQVYKEFGKTVWNFIYFKCGNKAQADDLLQEAFIKLWQNCDKVKKEKAKSFLYKVASNAFLNQVAHKKVVLEHALLQPAKADHQSPEFLLEEKEYLKKLQDAIASLTEAQRTTFLLNRIEGKKYAEIAELLNISIKTVEKRMSQALATLRKRI